MHYVNLSVNHGVQLLHNVTSKSHPTFSKLDQICRRKVQGVCANVPTHSLLRKIYSKRLEKEVHV